MQAQDGQIKASAETWPAMINMEANGILRMELPDGLQIADAVFTIDLSPTENLNDIQSVCIYTGDKDSPYIFEGYQKGEDATSQLAPKFSSDVPPAKMVKLKAPKRISMNSKAPYFWVSVKLKPTASLDRKVGCKLVEVKIGTRTYKPEEDVTALQRIGYAVAQSGGKVYAKISPKGKESKKYRIPGIVRAKNGDLVSVFDIRYDNRKDMPSNIHIGVRRSSDGGQTWSPIGIAMNYTGTKGNPKHPGNHNYDASFGSSDPSILVDEVTGNIWVAAITRFGIWSSQAGTNTDDKTSQFALVCSKDNGKTWEEPISISLQCKDKEWKAFFQGPGHGITMKDRGDGVRRLVFPAQIWDGKTFPRSCIVYSDDHGKTWKCEEQGKPAGGIPERSSEASVVELADGSLMLNARNENRGGMRYVYTTRDMGKTWEPHATNANSLRDPTCQASILAIEDMAGIKRALLFSNPDVSDSPRRDMTLKASFDEGMSWPQENRILYDSRPSCGYSDICPVGRTHIGILYEALNADECLFFLRIPISELEQKD